MRFVKGTWILFNKELRDNFGPPLVYVLSALFSLTLGWLFFNYLMLSKNLTNLNMTDAVLAPTFGNINLIFLFMAPLLTMRTFAEERKLNTLDLLFQSNLSDWQIIFGKFFSVVIVVVFMLFLTLIFPVVLALSGYNDWATVATGYLGVCLSVMCYVSVGMFASSLTENQIVAAMISFSILMGLMLLILSASATNNFMVGSIFRYISISYHYEGFARGIIRSFNLVYYISFIGFFLYLTKQSLNSRNW